MANDFSFEIRVLMCQQCGAPLDVETGEILELAGCDRLTISPQLLSDLKADNTPIAMKLMPEQKPENEELIKLDEMSFRYALNDNAMATEKLAEGIRNFVKDQVKLESMISGYL